MRTIAELFYEIFVKLMENFVVVRCYWNRVAAVDLAVVVVVALSSLLLFIRHLMNAYTEHGPFGSAKPPLASEHIAPFASDTQSTIHNKIEII